MAALKRSVLVVCAICLAVFDSLAADCPEPACFTSPPTLVVSAPPGGATDRLARRLAASMNEYLGQIVVVDNRAGATGNIAADLVAKSQKNGQTILIAPTSVLTLNDKLYRTLPFDARKDFAPVAIVASTAQMLVVGPTVPAKSLKEFVGLAKSQPGKINFASSGGGSTSHLAVEQLKQDTGMDLVHVPYKGIQMAANDVVGGQAQVMMADVATVMPFVKSGKLRALAVTGAKRSPLAADVPTFAEEGYKGFDAGATYGLIYPAGTHPNIVSRLNTAVRKSLERSDFKTFLAENGFEAGNPAPAEFARHLSAENDRWARVVKMSGMKLE